ncbi:Hsp70 family protein [bacterium]|nr:Hsp70 family protein [bacterium]
MAEFVLGIDLGTTNSALAWARAGGAGAGETPEKPAILEIPQVVAPGECVSQRTLPSFLYMPFEGEFEPVALDLPWTAPVEGKLPWVVGTFARDHGAKLPGRLVSSAKSWLSYGVLDRNAGVLPPTAPPDLAKISPVEASVAYLAHLRDAWNTHAAAQGWNAPFEDQEIYLTVPASFDTVARDLTIQAARNVGATNLTILEEPQAAFYAWLAVSGETWRKSVQVGDLVLVCDIGGGTSDFTLIAVGEEDGTLKLERVAVGDHILLGGDNMDLALAYAVAGTLKSGMDGLDANQKIALVHGCRAAKEKLFSDPKESKATITILGKGSKVIGGAIKATLEREMLEQVILSGFFPACGSGEAPARGRRLGLTEIGLPYAADPAITKHLAQFLARHGALSDGSAAAKPTKILFNGGVFEAAPLRDRLTETLTSWTGAEVPALPAADLHLSVALGAAQYGLARLGKGVRIRGGVNRSYYIGLETPAPAVPGVPPPVKALCVVPMGMEEGTQADVPTPDLGLYVGEEAEFRFLASTHRHDDVPGTVLDRWDPDALAELPPLKTTLEARSPEEVGQAVPVRIVARVTELGTIELSCRSLEDDRAWSLEYNLRQAEAGA